MSGHSIQTTIQINKIGEDSIKLMIQFKCQVIINTGRIRKVPEKCPKCVQIRQERFFQSEIKNINSKYDSFS